MKGRSSRLFLLGIAGIIICLGGVTACKIGILLPKVKPEVLALLKPPTASLTQVKESSTSLPTIIPPANPKFTLTPESAALTPVPKEGFSQTIIPRDTLATFGNTTVSINDPIRFAQMLSGGVDIPTQLEFPLRQYSVGDRETFWVLNSDANLSTQRQATLHFITDHVYFWVEDNVRFNLDHLKALMNAFENKIYPTNLSFFGSEWSPGVDADPRLYILYARDLGSHVAAYYYPYDEYLPLVHPYSNTHEMLYLNASRLGLAEPFAYSVLAHEHQHMIHWYLDRNEETWLNEGFSNLAAFVNGYDIGGADFSYVQNPDIQLNYWSNAENQRFAHYGAAFLFLAYFLDRFGETASQELVANPANGMSSVDAVLQNITATDQQTGEVITADDLFADWVIASFLQDKHVADGRYDYHNYPDAPQAHPTEYVDNCPSGVSVQDVAQYGVDYIRFNCHGSYAIKFEGSTQVNVLPQNPHSGEYAFYSNFGDESSMSLTRQFDFTKQEGPLTFSYWTWFDLERDYDYVYLMASVDGEHWQILTTPSGTAENPAGNNHGWGYTGSSAINPGQQESGSWIKESVDISQLAGKQVWLRFNYITDSAVYAEGFMVDDISIDETGYFTDFENDDGGWKADGFVRIKNNLPQGFRVSLILFGDQPIVQKITLDSHNQAVIPIYLSEPSDYAVLVVSGTARYTRQKAIYRFSTQLN